MTTTEQRAATVASRLTRFRECVDAIPDVAARLAQGQQFNAYESALNDEDAADEDCTMYLSIGSIDDRRAIVTVEGRAEADMIAHALTFASLASVSSASAEGWKLVPTWPTLAMLQAGGDCYGDSMSSDVWSAMLAASPEPVPATNQAGEVRRNDLYRMIDGFADFLTFDAVQRLKMRSRVRTFCAMAEATQPATSQEGEVTQADREAAASLIAGRPLADNVDIIRHAGADDGGFVQAFARHRIASLQQRFLTAQPANNQAKEGARLRAAFVETMQPLFLLETAEKLADNFMSKVSL